MRNYEIIITAVPARRGRFTAWLGGQPATLIKRPTSSRPAAACFSAVPASSGAIAT